MRRLALIALLLVACGPTAGTITAKDYEPAHDELRFRQQWSGQTCTGTGTGRVCTDTYISVPYWERVPDRWSLRLEYCSDADPSDCDRGTVTVNEATFNDVEVGDFYTEEET